MTWAASPRGARRFAIVAGSMAAPGSKAAAGGMLRAITRTVLLVQAAAEQRRGVLRQAVEPQGIELEQPGHGATVPCECSKKKRSISRDASGPRGSV
jgi:hypothetical protein